MKLPVVHVAHNRRIQDLMERRKLSWGVQLQIARGITQDIWTWEKISPETLDKLKGPAALAAPKVKEVICQSVGRSANDDVDISVWYAECLL
jgi:RNA-dependent RNA polymerase